MKIFTLPLILLTMIQAMPLSASDFDTIPDLPGIDADANAYLPEVPLEFNGYIWPAKGVVTSGFGKRWGQMHKGIDVAGPIGTPIIAAAGGEVITRWLE